MDQIVGKLDASGTRRRPGEWTRLRRSLSHVGPLRLAIGEAIGLRTVGAVDDTWGDGKNGVCLWECRQWDLPVAPGWRTPGLRVSCARLRGLTQSQRRAGRGAWPCCQCSLGAPCEPPSGLHG